MANASGRMHCPLKLVAIAVLSIACQHHVWNAIKGTATTILCMYIVYYT